MTIQINGTTGISGVDGSAATPALQGTDSNTGIHFPAADTVAIDTGGSERLRVNSSGNVGIGTTSPRLRTHIRGDSANAPTLGVASGSLIVGPNDNDYGMMFGVSGSGWGWIQAQNFVTPGGAAYDLALQPSGGRVLVGTSTSSSYAGLASYIQLEQSGGTDAISSIWYNNNDALGPYLILGKSRGTTAGSNTVVQSGDSLGRLAFFGADGTDRGQWGAHIACEVDGTPGTNDMPGRLVFSTTADGASSPTERMRINNSGQILIGKASDTLSTAGWAIDGGSTIGRGQLTCGSSGAPILRLNHTGGAATEYVVESWKNGTQVGSISVTASATAYNTSSDYRLKENVTPLTGAVDRLNQLQVHRFNFIVNPDKTVDGFIAHEAQAVVPEAVTGTKDEVDADGNPVYQGIDQSKLVPLLTAALQEALAKIESLETRLNALEGN